MMLKFTSDFVLVDVGMIWGGKFGKFTYVLAELAEMRIFFDSFKESVHPE
ncbi:hypothetical protein [Pleionea sediminis]|nr:hypothetical protein [Pleionea sediminis]